MVFTEKLLLILPPYILCETIKLFSPPALLEGLQKGFIFFFGSDFIRP